MKPLTVLGTGVVRPDADSSWTDDVPAAMKRPVIAFATTAGSLKVAQVGLKVEPVVEVKRLARQLKVER